MPRAPGRLQGAGTADVVTELPKSATGKLLKRVLREQAVQR